MAQIAFVLLLFGNHLRFPLFLDLMEGVVLQHFQRAAAFQPIYPAPTPDFVPLAYNPLYYVLAIPFSWMGGVTLTTLRLVACLGTIASGLLLYRIVRECSRSAWWGLIAAGLFAAAYRAMVCYLDTAHSDSWLLASALLGSYLLARARTPMRSALAVGVLVAAFWFKQHGAFFALGGLMFVLWRDGWRKAVPACATALLLGPALYLLAGPRLFGSHFLYFTWQVPRQWSQFDWHAAKVLVGFIAATYPLLAVTAAMWLWHALRTPRQLAVWHFQLVAALLTGALGALDPGCSYNVFIPLGTFLILSGTLGLAQWSSARTPPRLGPATLALLGSFALLVWNPTFVYTPQSVLVSAEAPAAYADLVGFLQSRNGPVCAPGLGQLPDGYRLYPAVHWVALEDMVRGPRRNTRDQPIVQESLEPAVHPAGPAYLLTNRPLEGYAYFLGFLQPDYVLEADLHNRFRALNVLPGRYEHGWPRYLYRHVPQSAPEATTATAALRR